MKSHTLIAPLLLFIAILVECSAQQVERVPRIGVTSSKLARIAQWRSAEDLQRNPYKLFATNLYTLVPIFQARLNLATPDFGGVGGYQYCTKIVSTMGLLAQQGNLEAVVVGKQALMAAVLPFTRALPGGVPLSAVVTDTTRSYSDRIRAFNLLRESATAALPPSRGDPIFLEVGSMSMCLAIGYDWLYHSLTSQERVDVQRAIREVLLWSNNLYESFFTEASPPAQRDSNWNAVINGGSGALGIAAMDSIQPFACTAILNQKRSSLERRNDSLTTLARERVCQAVVGLRFLRRTFTDAGAYLEGPSYWFYGMQSFSVFAETLLRTLGRVDLEGPFNALVEPSAKFQRDLLYDSDPFWESKSAGIIRVGMYSFADSAPSLVPSSWPFIYAATKDPSSSSAAFGWRLLNQQAINETTQSPTVWAQHSFDWSRVFSLLADPTTGEPTVNRKRMTTYTTPDHIFDVAVLRTTGGATPWTVHQKGGVVTQPHAHLDSGSFTLRIGESNWLSDLGYEQTPQNRYPSSYFVLPTDDSYSGGLRFFRKNDLSHTLVTLAGRPINLHGRAAIVSAKEGVNPSDGAPSATVEWDTTSLYSPVVRSAKRTLTLIDRGRYTTLDVNDELIFPKNTNFSALENVASWRTVTCLPSQSGSSVTLPAKNLIRIRHSPTSSLTALVHRPTNPIVRIGAANPNTDPLIKRSFLNEVENSNEGCSLLEVYGTGAELEDYGDGKRLLFTVRIQRSDGN